MKQFSQRSPLLRPGVIGYSVVLVACLSACGGGASPERESASSGVTPSTQTASSESPASAAESASAPSSDAAAEVADSSGSSAMSSVKIAAATSGRAGTSTASEPSISSIVVTGVRPSTSSLSAASSVATQTGNTAVAGSAFTPTINTAASRSEALNSTASPATPTTLTPGPNDLQGLKKVGRIDAKSGQIIENVEISNPNGPCVVVASGVRDVIIRRSRIGPCGPTKNFTDYGVFILEGATNITVQSNVIHDVSSGVKAHKATSPVIVDRNYFYNIRGPYYNGQAIQFNAVSGGTKASKVTCNVSDAIYGVGAKAYEDHISMFAANGTEAQPIEIAYNRVRGGTSKTGGGITVGDGGGSWINVHDNVVVTVANSGIGVAGGNNIRVENNRVDNRGLALSSQTHMAYFVRALSTCRNITVRGNRGIARLWNWNEIRGDVVAGYRHGPEMCASVDDAPNTFGDATLSSTMFDDKPTPCK